MDEWVDSPNRLQRSLRKIIATRLVGWGLSHTIHHLDRAVIRLSDGRTSAAALFTGLPIIALTTTGARSGRPRTVPLVGIPDDERLILIASNWGQERHPGWYHNIRANPQVTVRYDGQEAEYTAREVSGEEREAYWKRATTLYPGYRQYAVRTGREIPIMVLERRLDAG
ncbi:MAG: nitroreductase family deazaflavin-dependent oxidoreductase [Chloroflexota bacterium]|jgi:deazaflavin-dependent oxidoreductase (nitroreductase family)